MLKHRLVVVLILSEGQIVQSVQFKLTNVIHAHPDIAVDFFNLWAVDEIVLLDVSRSTDKRDRFYDALDKLSRKCMVPLAVGGWVTSIEEMKRLLGLGADKIILNTAAVRNPSLITEGALCFGRQCMVVSIDARRQADCTYRVHIDRGREPTEHDPVLWAQQARDVGAGELFLNCIDNDGFRKGYDLKLLKAITSSVNIPVVAMGGVFTWQHLVEGITLGGADAVAAANIFHYTEHSTKKAKKHMRNSGVNVR
ncbi:imidazole glycerol phosphate synthase cyclase subunit [Desulfocurvibacter africanus]|uniref:imidazole glycerol phosphate synthase subunit HisF n=1 Tax=Desulfocurvibacter africanus TaxID=873 RepID=UPI002FDB3A85